MWHTSCKNHCSPDGVIGKRSINTEVPTLGDSLSWDTNQCVCDITTLSSVFFREGGARVSRHSDVYHTHTEFLHFMNISVLQGRRAKHLMLLYLYPIILLDSRPESTLADSRTFSHKSTERISSSLGIPESRFCRIWKEQHHWFSLNTTSDRPESRSRSTSRQRSIYRIWARIRNPTLVSPKLPFELFSFLVWIWWVVW